LSSHLLSKNVKIKIYKTIILLVVSHGCEILSPTLREGYSLRLFGNTGAEENIWTKEGRNGRRLEKTAVSSFITYTLNQI
jgi:hypothetical protein